MICSKMQSQIGLIQGVLGKILQIPIDEEEPEDEDSSPSTNEELLDKSKDIQINAALESDASQDAVILEAQIRSNVWRLTAPVYSLIR